MSRRQRIWDKIMSRCRRLEPVGDQTVGCLEWLGPTSGDGRGGEYGRACIDGATMAVHRVMWIIEHGPIPPRKQLDHGEYCSRRCCEPAHLELVTHKENCRRRDERARKKGLLRCVGTAEAPSRS